MNIDVKCQQKLDAMHPTLTHTTSMSAAVQESHQSRRRRSLAGLPGNHTSVIVDITLIHSGLRRQVKGYDSRITTDSERRFTATSWQTGRMRTRLRRDGIFIFIDDSRSGINTCGFCFWNVVVVDQDGRVHTVS